MGTHFFHTLTLSRDSAHCGFLHLGFAIQATIGAIIMSSENEMTVCPLCHGHGKERKELLVVRWRSRELEQQLQKIADEAAFGTSSGLGDPFEVAEPIYSNEAD